MGGQSDAGVAKAAVLHAAAADPDREADAALALAADGAAARERPPVATRSGFLPREGRGLERALGWFSGHVRAAWQLAFADARLSLAERCGRVACLALAVLVAYRAWLATRMAFADPINYYDEGIVLTGANQLLWGKLPYRDFYSNYPPGVFLLLGLCFRAFGASVAVERAVGLVFHLAIALLAGRLAARLEAGRFSWWVLALVLTWLVPLHLTAVAWLGSLALALLACEVAAWARARGGAARHALVGVVFGAVSWFRHDLFAYFATALCLAGALSMLQCVRRGGRAPLAARGWMVLGTLGALACMWLPVLAFAGVEQPLRDLLLDQLRYVVPARELPVPDLLALTRVSWFPIALPAFLTQTTEGALALELVAPVLLLAAVVLPRASGLERRADAVWLAALSLAVLPQALGRSDLPHALYCVAPGAIAVGSWLTGGSWRAWRPGSTQRSLAGALLLFTPAAALPNELAATPVPEGSRRASTLPAHPERAMVLTFIEAHGRAGDPLYVGFTDHRWISVNEMDLYFASDRVGATRYMQFEPNLVNRQDVQLQMIAELERSRPRVAVLSKRSQRMGEPNASATMGASLLDEYLRSQYPIALELLEYRIGLRK